MYNKFNMTFLVILAVVVAIVIHYLVEFIFKLIEKIKSKILKSSLQVKCSELFSILKNFIGLTIYCVNTNLKDYNTI